MENEPSGTGTSVKPGNFLTQMQIGRALAVFCVDEVVVYNDGTTSTEDTGGISEPNSFLAHVLRFLETPQYSLPRVYFNLDISALIYFQCILTFDMQLF